MRVAKYWYKVQQTAYDAASKAYWLTSWGSSNRSPEEAEEDAHATMERWRAKLGRGYVSNGPLCGINHLGQGRVVALELDQRGKMRLAFLELHQGPNRAEGVALAQQQIDHADVPNRLAR